MLRLIMNDDSKPKKLSLLQVIRSVLSAAIGVQSSKNRQRDFEGGNLKAYIIVGLVVVAVFISTLIIVVSNVINQ